MHGLVKPATCGRWRTAGKRLERMDRACLDQVRFGDRPCCFSRGASHFSMNSKNMRVLAEEKAARVGIDGHPRTKRLNAAAPNAHEWKDATPYCGPGWNVSKRRILGSGELWHTSCSSNHLDRGRGD